jgi:hypothetical protein
LITVSRRSGTPHPNRAVTALATTAVAMSGVVALAPSAQARDTSVWDRVAACESSGDWRINTGNHYFGGLQFWQPTWRDYGGRKYAPRADLATRQQQVEVARRVLADQGPKAWPVCSKHAKLTRRNGHATQAPLPNIGPIVRSVPTVHRSQPAQQPRPSYFRYEVRSGDSLSMIAERHHVQGGWPELWRINRTNVPNPNVLFIGQVIHIPTPR